MSFKIIKYIFEILNNKINNILIINTAKNYKPIYKNNYPNLYHIKY